MSDDMLQKNAFTFRISEEMMAFHEGFGQKGHLEPVTPTAKQIAQHARAKKLVKEFTKNPFVRVTGMDWEIEVEPLKTERWVADETHDEWMARYRAHRNTPLHDLRKERNS